jgi:hypothetical protein
MRKLSTTLITTAAALALTGTASAQTRHGFFFGGGIGYGSGDASTEETRGDLSQIGGLDSGREGGLTINLRLGKTISPRLALGAELNGYFRSEDLADISLFNATAAFYLYPADAGFFVKGGLGLARANFSLDNDDLSGLGFGAMVGVGYDFAIGESLAVTPQAAYWFGSPGDMSVDDIDILHGFRHNVIEVGVGITLY